MFSGIIETLAPVLKVKDLRQTPQKADKGPASSLTHPKSSLAGKELTIAYTTSVPTKDPINNPIGVPISNPAKDQTGTPTKDSTGAPTKVDTHKWSTQASSTPSHPPEWSQSSQWSQWSQSLPLRKGASIAINGVCTTVTHFDDKSFSCFLSVETLSITNLQFLKEGDLINLETSLRYGASVDGHLLYGHVDSMLTLEDQWQESASRRLRFTLPSEYRPYIISKGPIALNGISLTVYAVDPHALEVMIIPYTYTHTNLHALKPNDVVNVEFDSMPKYLENFFARQKQPKQPFPPPSN